MLVQLGLVKVTKDKLRVQNAARANLMTFLTRRHANNVQSQRISMAKEETVVALIVQWVGCPKMAVRNAKRAVRGRSVTVAKIAHWGLQEKEMTLIQRSADHVHWARQRRWKARPRAVGVI